MQRKHISLNRTSIALAVTALSIAQARQDIKALDKRSIHIEPASNMDLNPVSIKSENDDALYLSGMTDIVHKEGWDDVTSIPEGDGIKKTVANQLGGNIRQNWMNNAQPAALGHHCIRA